MKILLVEDNEALRKNIATVLVSEGYTVEECADGTMAEYNILHNSSDVIIMDRMLPGQDGVTLTKLARLHKIVTPIIMLTALNTLGDKLTGLDAGADDYIVKPFDMEELLARIRIWSRRVVPLENPDELAVGNTMYAPVLHLLKGPQGEEVLPNRLAQLAELLFRNAKLPLSRRVIFSRIWGPGADVNESIIDTYIHLLRQRFEHIGSDIMIINNRGTGYQLELNKGETDA